ncbi:MAG: 1-deoxy-D-xylulose-5-phosphate reductoisomerase [Bacteroidales bacterium]
MKKRLCILGSTGSVGTQALEVVSALHGTFSVEVLSAQNNVSLLIAQAKQFKPDTVVIANKAHYQKVSDALSPLNIKVFAGEDSLTQVVEMEHIDLVLNALVGYVALKPTLQALEYGKTVAMANKETFAVAGELMTSKAREKKAMVLPVDSEHSAIFQCLCGEGNNPIEKIYLTASGGPFRKHSPEALKHVTKNDALKHPNWNMGNKITIDSASLMNKGLEVIEARWLFDLKPRQIEVIVHPQSVIHSMVQFEDSSIKAQMGLPDMKLPVQYALTYPHRIKNTLKRFSFAEHPNLSFEQPRREVFKNLDLAYYALEKEGNMPCVLNAANEVAVHAFLNEQIGFLQMSEVIEDALNNSPLIQTPCFEELVETDTHTRRRSAARIKELTKKYIE